MEEVNADRELHGKKPFDDDDEPPTPTKKKLARRKGEAANSCPGRDRSGQRPVCEGEHKRQFAYEAHTACDKHGFVLEAVVTPGNVHDSVAFDEVYDRVRAAFRK